MSRIPPAQAPYAPAVQAAFDSIMPAGVAPLALFRTLAVAPRVFERFRAGALLDRGPLSLRQREIAIARTCALNGCEYEWGVHVTFFAEKARLSPEQLRATVDGSPAGWSHEEQAILALCEELHRGTQLSDDLWATLQQHFSTEQILELMALAGFYRTVALFANGLRLPLEPYAARFPATA
ncbi:carboxymuconolactone decarboxylase family protein [Eleftheria terrae]|uniref:carboxymuconolactone decarboxylase family protein n=1 Tax=Eleftheria terrae TaxID=1597781 RepID=UPI00263ABD12|nr:carboxymuconolactone decarboxylase family protein [Eleftheria terrae]WKB54206.1 carboxymuconolactone decarboxylase family protein [Eleftheria terrae]